MKISQQFFNLIEKSRNILISFPIDWDGDAVSSSLALALYLKGLGKNVDVGAEKMKNFVNFTTPLSSFKFLPGFSEIKTSLEHLMNFVVSVDLKHAKVSQVKYTIEEGKLNFIISPQDGFFTKEDIKSSMSGFKYDLIITINSNNLESLGRIYDSNIDFFYKTPIINIDNSPKNEDFGQLNIVDLTAVATSDIIFEKLLFPFEDRISEDVATCLLAGIIIKTKSFKTNNLTPKTLKITSRLIELGARREEIVNNLYRSRSLPTLKLWGRVLNNLSFSDNNHIVWTTLFKNDFKESKSGEENLQDVIDELIVSIPSAKLIVIFYSLSELSVLDNYYLAPEDQADFSDKTVIVHPNKDQDIFETKVALYSVKNLDSLELLKKFNPEGSSKLAQVSLNRPIKEVEKELIASLSHELDKIF
ncbi:MAG: DHH family phosphoesterase [Patescibacteria group bacterium]